MRRRAGNFRAVKKLLPFSSRNGKFSVSPSRAGPFSPPTTCPQTFDITIILLPFRHVLILEHQIPLWGASCSLIWAVNDESFVASTAQAFIVEILELEWKVIWREVDLCWFKAEVIAVRICCLLRYLLSSILAQRFPWSNVAFGRIIFIKFKLFKAFNFMLFWLCLSGNSRRWRC